MRAFLFLLLSATVLLSPVRAAEPPRNLALEARASASESQGDFTPEKAIDGNMGTRWSGIPGHNAGVWYQLEWKEPVEIGEVVVHQYDRYVIEFDVQVRAVPAAEWRTVQHFGRAGQRLPKVVACRFGPRRRPACGSPTSPTVRASPKCRSMPDRLPVRPPRRWPPTCAAISSGR